MRSSVWLRPVLAYMLLCLCRSPVLLAAADGPTPYPDSKNDAAWPGKGPIRVFGWMNDNRKYFWTQRQKDQNAIVFAGDSLTGNWKPDQMAAALPKLKVANRGIGGDGSRGLLFRFKEDVLDLKPKGIVICIGTNDLSAHGDPAAVEGNLKLMLKQVRNQSATLPVVLCNIPPRDAKDAPTRPAAHEDLNRRIAALAGQTKHVVLLDLHAALADDSGKPKAEYFAKDRLHISPAGYDRWAEVIRPLLETLKGR